MLTIVFLYANFFKIINYNFGWCSNLTEENYLMWLSTIPGLTLKRQKILLSIFGSAHDIWSAPKNLIFSISGIPTNILENIISYKNEKKLAAYESFMIKNEISFVSMHSNLYPELLKQIPNPPLGIYILGTLSADSSSKISIVGSRKFTEYGSYAAKKLSYDLSSKGIVIVSGMARGIDSVAHKAALEAGGKTIAVLGCGIDVCYPPENGRLRYEIIQNGCLISEFPLGTKPFVGNFPLRNRIISGLSKGLIVVEASEKSGTLITVGHALEQGREVMAVPGAINSGLSRGTNYLIKQGANLISDCSDVLEIIGESGLIKNTENKVINNEVLLEADEELVYNIINFSEVSFDFIVSKLDLPINKLSSCLIMLEMKGVIKKLPGSKYIRI